jgi:hypothetical protein
MAERKNPGRDVAGETSKPDDLSDETVRAIKENILFGGGFKRPPEDTRFKKGQSGNPKGRPKRTALEGGSKRARNLILDEAERPITIREGDETKQMPAVQVVLRAAIKSAANGNAYAQKHVIERFAWADRERQAEIEVSNAYWQDYVDRHRAAIAEAERNREKPPTPLPHPDDVIIDEEKWVRIVGPIDAAEVAKLEESLKLRDVLIMQNALDVRLSTDLNGKDRPGTALVFASLMNDAVPARFRLSDAEFITRMMRYEGTPKRALLKMVYGSWRDLGRNLRRGHTSPPLQTAIEQVNMVFDAMRELAAGEGTPRSGAVA